jgi:hypothetical protein
MFTIKFYTDNGRCIIRAAESFTILRDEMTGEVEITLHQRDGDAESIFVSADQKRVEGWPPAFQWAYIENAMGKTVERIHLKPVEAA